MSIYIPTAEQKSLIVNDDSAVVEAGPGRGKTATAIAAADAWAGRHAGERVLFTSFSNAAVRRIASAAGFARHHTNLEFQTYHSVAFDLLRLYGRFAGLPAPAQVLDKTEEHLVALTEDWPDDDDAYAGSRRAFARRTGRVAFADMIRLVTRLLVTSHTLRGVIQRRYGCIVVDEFQDTTDEQWSFLQLIAANARLLVFGDPHQMIADADFAATRARFAACAAWKCVPITRFVGRNYRCAATDILDFAEAVLRGQAYKPAGPALHCTAAFTTKRRYEITRQWKIFRDRKDDGSIAIIAPSAKIAREVASDIRTPPPTVVMPIPIHAHVEPDEAAADAVRLGVCAAADFARERSIVHCHQLAIALVAMERAWKRSGKVDLARVGKVENALRPGSKKKSPVRMFIESDPPSDIGAFAHGFVEAMANDVLFKSTGEAISKTGLPHFRVHTDPQARFTSYRSARTPVGLHGHLCGTQGTTVLSMSRAKGREFDYVILLVDHYAHPQHATLGELQRLHYVGCTRARRELAVIWNASEKGLVLTPVLGP
jgi:superfamily I DNA/RNA helicase